MKKIINLSMAVLAALIFLAGCAGGGTSSSGSGSGISLSNPVTTADFSSTDYSGGAIALPEDAEDSLELAGYLLEPVVLNSFTYLAGLYATSTLDDWLNANFALTTPTEDLEALFSALMNKHAFPSTILGVEANDAPFGTFAQLGGEVTGTIDTVFYDDEETKAASEVFSLSLDNIDYDIIAPLASTTTSVEEGRLTFSLNLNATLDYTYDDSGVLTSADCEYSISLRGMLALSGSYNLDNDLKTTGDQMQGHVLADFAFDDSDSIILTAAMLVDHSLIGAVIGPDNFSFSIQAYGDPAGDAVVDDSLSLEDLFSLIEDMIPTVPAVP